MSTDRSKLRWNGWGATEAGFEFGEHEGEIYAWLQRELGLTAFESRPA
jgi:hypothetical protein